MITTDHLSKYGVFSVSGEGARKARIQFLGLWGTAGNENFMAAVEEYASSGVPAAKRVEIGAGAVGDALQLAAIRKDRGSNCGPVARAVGSVRAIFMNGGSSKRLINRY